MRKTVFRATSDVVGAKRRSSVRSTLVASIGSPKLVWAAENEPRQACVNDARGYSFAWTTSNYRAANYELGANDVNPSSV